MTTEAWEEVGSWWLPEQPQQSGTGTLRFDPEQGLRLIGLTGDWLRSRISRLETRDVAAIHGQTPLGVLYTCSGNFIQSITESSRARVGTVVTADVDVRSVLKAGHFNNDSTFQTFSCLYTNLHTWLIDFPALNVSDVEGEERTVQVRHQRGDLWTTDTGYAIAASNTYSFNQFQTNDPNPTIKFDHLDGLYLTCHEPKRLAELFQVEYGFRLLINLLGGCQLQCHEVRCDDDIESFDSRTMARFNRREDAKQGVMPVSYREVAQQFPAILKKWFELLGQVGPIVNLYFFGKNSPLSDLATNFLAAMQGLERYHRAFHGGFFVPQEEYDRTVRPALDEAIPSGLSSDFRQRLQSAIKYGYEFSLRRRLRDLVSVLPDTNTFAEVSAASFLNQSVETRNSLVHQLQAQNVFGGATLYRALCVWREVLFALILHKLEIPETIIDSAVRRLQLRRGILIPS